MKKMALSLSNIISCLAVIFTVLVLNPTYIHLIVWKKPTIVSLSTFGLEGANADRQLVIKSHLSSADATAYTTEVLAEADRMKQFLATPGLKQDKFTIVMPTYKRTETLHSVFQHYCGMNDIIDQLIMIWHNLGEEVPDRLKNYNCKFPITFLKPKVNSLNNRFVPYPEIKTECVMSLDDDRVITRETLLHGFEMWKVFPHLLVGYIARIHGYNPITHSYFYRVQGVTTPQPYSISLTIAAFMHHKYLEEYTNTLPSIAKEFIDTNFNCEDLFMVATIARFLKKNDKPQCASLWLDEVAANLKHARLGLSSDRSHYTERDRCLNMMVELFGEFPLKQCSLYIGKKE